MDGATEEKFEDFVWLFQCDSRNRGLVAQGFDEAALLWKATRATGGNILEIGRKKAGSTVLLTAASDPSRKVYSVDLRLRPRPPCKEYLERPENQGRVELLVANSRETLPNLNFGMLFIDGDHSFEGVLADVVAHWNALKDVDGKPGLAAFHDAVPNDNFKWRDQDRALKRRWTRWKNMIRSRKKPEIAEDYSRGVNRVCDRLIVEGMAEEWGKASSMLVLRKLGDLPADFQDRMETAARS